jgi:hypothetical protein
MKKKGLNVNEAVTAVRSIPTSPKTTKTQSTK